MGKVCVFCAVSGKRYLNFLSGLNWMNFCERRRELWGSQRYEEWKE